MRTSRALQVKAEQTEWGLVCKVKLGQSLMTWMRVKGWSQGVPKALDKSQTDPRIPCVAVYSRIGRFFPFKFTCIIYNSLSLLLFSFS